jgi:hypothetical protein
MTSRGGCAIFVKQQLKLIVNHLQYSPDLEVIAISCDQKNASTFYLSCVYKPPNSSTEPLFLTNALLKFQNVRKA